MTEDEAKTKWCVECLSQSNAIYPRCQGSDCMAWRWLLPASFDHWLLNKVASADPKRVGVAPTPTHGYCGLAGKPEFTP